MQTLQSANRRITNGHHAILYVLPFVQLGVGGGAKHRAKIIFCRQRRTFSGNHNHLRNARPLFQELVHASVDIFWKERNNCFCGIIDDPLWRADDCTTAGSFPHWLLNILEFDTGHDLQLVLLCKCIKKADTSFFLPEPSRLTTNLMVWPGYLALPLQLQELLTECV